MFIIPPYTLYFKLFIVRKWMYGVFFEMQFTGLNAKQIMYSLTFCDAYVRIVSLWKNAVPGRYIRSISW